LRTGQGDLFRSLKSLLMSSSSKIKVYATAPMEDGRRPEFVHAKYVVIDGKWTALGSWNLWTRSAFYEMELEAFVESVSVARHLQQKFASDSEKYATVLQTAKDCEPEGGFCPSGCDLCRGFGPFIQ
jgi:phosphatidylserine/phosphatidylglycerophosphate/cardiolipin synthase-like enzyme